MVSHVQAQPMTDPNRGDRFMEQFAAHSRAIFTFIFSQVRDANRTEDIFQETCKVLWQKYDQFDQEESFRAWAIGIARNEVLMARRKEGKSARLFGDQLASLMEQAAAERVQTADERSFALRRCYGKLSDNDQHLIDLRYREEITVEMISEETGRSVHAIYRSLRRIHRALYECIHQTLSRGGWN